MTGVAVVSGGSRGLGRAVCERLLADGWQVATFSRQPNEFVEQAQDKHAADFHWSPLDARDLGRLRGFARIAQERFGRVDLLVNNAGSLHQELFLTTAVQRMEDLLTTNLLAPMVLAQGCARVMMGGGGGAIVNVSSINAVRGYRGVAAYSAAKAGLEAFSRSLARELGPAGIRVNTLTPGFFDSDMTAQVTADNRDRIRRRTPLGRFGTVDEVVDAVMFLASPQSGFITGQRIIIDGGITC
ncbi:SDR family oxidoreductase [Catellatospora sp. NPDC049609]|uniref:SDR family NAD(P)-dependent oxidoreductase n=1 Tax=Catellatospora sp. NPDC049609 TaxID=3155505 RepID=UPI003433C98D